MSAKRTGKSAKDIFAPTTTDGTEVTVSLDAEHVEYIDQLASSIEAKRGARPGRADVIRNLIKVVKRSGMLNKTPKR